MSTSAPVNGYTLENAKLFDVGGKTVLDAGCGGAFVDYLNGHGVSSDRTGYLCGLFSD
jgi:hypothetical protein